MGWSEPASQLSCLVLGRLIGDLCLPEFSSLDSGDRCVVGYLTRLEQGMRGSVKLTRGLKLLGLASDTISTPDDR